jgi:hypothetical protein
MNKTERTELSRLLKTQFKLLRADVAARKAELQAQLEQQVADEYAAADRAYDEAMFAIGLAKDEANRKINDIGRELYGREVWGDKHDRTLVTVAEFPRPGKRERQERRREGEADIERQVAAALLELQRQESELLVKLLTSALESADAQAFFAQIPKASDLVPAYRLKQIAGEFDV